jgi:hypothetical protein
VNIFLDELTTLRNTYQSALSEKQLLRLANDVMRKHVPAPLGETAEVQSALLNCLKKSSTALLVQSNFSHLSRVLDTAMTAPTPFVVTAYRGEHGPNTDNDILHSRRGSYSFGSKEAALTYATNPNDIKKDTLHSPRLIQAQLTINNPVFNDPDDPFVDLKLLINAVGLERTIMIARAQIDHLSNTDNWADVIEAKQLDHLEPKEALEQLLVMGGDTALDELYMDAYPVFDEPDYVAWFVEAGFDGLIQGGNGETAMQAEYKIFSPEQALVLSVEPLEPVEHAALDVSMSRRRA